jgi:hypothetical protein
MAAEYHSRLLIFPGIWEHTTIPTDMLHGFSQGSIFIPKPIPVMRQYPKRHRDRWLTVIDQSCRVNLNRKADVILYESRIRVLCTSVTIFNAAHSLTVIQINTGRILCSGALLVPSMAAKV